MKKNIFETYIFTLLLINRLECIINFNNVKKLPQIFYYQTT